MSEYNEPAPNDYSAETMPLLASYAVWQNWDGIFLFDYASDKSTFHNDYFNTWFDIDKHPGKMAFFPAAAVILMSNTALTSQVPTKILRIPDGQIASLAMQTRMNSLLSGAGLLGNNAISNPIRTQFAAIDNTDVISIPPSGENSINLQWNVDTTAKIGLYSVSTPQWNAIVNYNSNPTPIKSGDLTITPLNKERPFGAYTLTSMDNKPVNTSGKLLLTAGGFVENQEMGWNADRTSVSDQWGHGPVMAEGLNAKISIKTSVRNAKVFALDVTGKEKAEVPSQWSGGKLTFTISPQFATMWYAIEKQ